MEPEHIPILELHIKPTYAVCIPQRPRGRKRLSEAQRANTVNLLLAKNIDPVTGEKINRPNVLSKKAIRRLTNAVNWLVVSAKNKSVYDSATSKRYSFRVNFVTLTLPTTDHNISDHFFKKVLLHNFINTCSYKYGMRNYVWKVEAQENGNIHAHFTTDVFIHWKDLRKTWNQILANHGIIDAYTKKHCAMSWEQYREEYSRGRKVSEESLRKAFTAGSECGWTNPNTTDVHAVHKVSDIAAYLAKYMSKKEEDRREIKGRLWGASHSLSEKNKLMIELCGSSDNDILAPMFSPEVEYKTITSESKLTGNTFRCGEIFFYKTSYWGSVFRGRLLAEFNKHRFQIRNGIIDNTLLENIPATEKKSTIYRVDELDQPDQLRISI